MGYKKEDDGEKMARMQGLERAPIVLEERLTPVIRGSVHRAGTCYVLLFSSPQLQIHGVTGIEKDKAE